MQPDVGLLGPRFRPYQGTVSTTGWWKQAGYSLEVKSERS